MRNYLLLLAPLLASLASRELAAQFPADCYVQYDHSARPIALQLLRIIPGAPIVEVARYDTGASGPAVSASEPNVFDPRSGEFWAKGSLEVPPYTRLLRRYEFRNGQVVATTDTIDVPDIGQVAGADFDDDGTFVVCTHGGAIHTIDFLGRRLVRTLQLQVAGFTSWIIPPVRGRYAVAEYESLVPSPRVIVGLFDENGVLVRRIFEQLNPNYPALPTYFRGGLTTSNGRTFFSSQHPSFPGLYEVVGTSMMRRSEVTVSSLGPLMEDPSRGILHFAVGGFVHQNRGEFDLRTGSVRYLLDPFLPNSTWWRNLGHFPRQRLQLSPARPAANTAFDAVLALGGEPNDLGLVLFRHATVAGIPQLELNTLVALAPFDASGLQRTVLRYDPALFGLRAGDELRFQGFGWDGSSLWSTPEQVLRWR